MKKCGWDNPMSVENERELFLGVVDKGCLDFLHNCFQSGAKKTKKDEETGLYEISICDSDYQKLTSDEDLLDLLFVFDNSLVYDSKMRVFIDG